MSERALALVSGAFFHGYLGLCVVAGAGGALLGRRDVRLVAGFDPHEELSPRAAATLLSQHRFLRALEAGFGVLCLRDRERIHTEPASNRRFLALMAGGIGARVLARAADGRPNAGAYAFGGLEAVGLAAIYAHTRTTLER